MRRLALASGIGLALATLLGALAGCGFAARPTRGVVLISLDTLRADHLGSYGYPLPTSPFFDRLAARGTLFERHVVQIPSTLPSHMSMLTGRYPGEHGVYGPNAVLSPEIPLLAELLQRHGVRTAGHTEGGWMSRAFGFARGFDEWNETPYADDTDVARTFDRGLAFLRSLPAGQRFFLFLHTYSIHDPYRPPDAYRRQFWPGAPPPDAPDPTGPNLERANAGELALSAAVVDYYRALYDASIRYVDGELERFFGELERLGLAGQTTVIVTSDHGEEFREHGRVAHTQAYWEELHAPLLVVHPGQRRGARVVSISQAVDLAPTVLELAGVAAPAMSGRSLVPRLREPAAPSDERGYSEAEIFWGTSKSLVEARGAGLEQLLLFSPTPDGMAYWSTGELRLDTFENHLEFRAVTIVEPRPVEVWSDGELVTTLEVQPAWGDFAVDLPGAAGRQRHVTLRSATCVVPAAIGLGDDERCLAFKIKGVPLDRVELYDLAADPHATRDLSGSERARVHELSRRLGEYRHQAIHPIGRQQLPAAQIEQLKALGYL